MQGFDEERLEVVVDGLSQRHILVEHYTGEKALLPGAKSWSLHFAADGVGFLHAPSEEPVWCADLLHQAVFQHPSNPEDLHVLVDGSEMPLWEFRRRHNPLQIRLKLAGSKTVVEVTVYRLLQPVGGALLLWSLPDIYGLGVRSSTMSCSQWYQSWWPWWEKSLMSLGLAADLHLRRSGFTKRGRLPPSEVDSTGPRFLPVPTMSTIALLHFLARMCSPSRGSKDKCQSQIQAWMIVLTTVIQQLLCGLGVVELYIYLDPATVVRPGLPSAGTDGVRLRVAEGTIDFSPVALCDKALVCCKQAEVLFVLTIAMLPLHLCLRG